MDEQTRLDLVKVECMAAGSSIYDEWFKTKLKTAEQQISKRMKLDLEHNIEHNNLVITYVKWMWDCRENPATPMPGCLRIALNDEQFKQHLNKKGYVYD